MMREFSGRTITGLSQHKVFSLLLPSFKTFLEINLEKEVSKDREVIASASQVLQQGQSPDENHVQKLLLKSREIDQEFLDNASVAASAIDIRYHEIDPIRKKRIEHLINVSYNVLREWDEASRLRQVITNLYSYQQFDAFLRKLLGLYIEETRVLSRSIKIPGKLAFIRNKIIDTVHSEMEDAAEKLVTDLADIIYRNK